MFLWVQELPSYTELGTSLASFSKSQAVYPHIGSLEWTPSSCSQEMGKASISCAS